MVSRTADDFQAPTVERNEQRRESQKAAHRCGNQAQSHACDDDHARCEESEHPYRHGGHGYAPPLAAFGAADLPRGPTLAPFPLDDDVPTPTQRPPRRRLELLPEDVRPCPGCACTCQSNGDWKYCCNGQAHTQDGVATNAIAMRFTCDRAPSANACPRADEPLPRCEDFFMSSRPSDKEDETWKQNAPS